ncbi:MAG: tRNA (guanosine(37)-N1)-methyltransferase TrmD [Clostridia bacterium]|nr:tRNA (guanosine(37)-N1)-methyltransferase TrmD [Clostridia bacterium]
MKFDIMTLFPECIEAVLSTSVIGRARSNGVINISTHNIRDYSTDKHRRVDDTPCGGGMGMLMSVPPIAACHRAIIAQAPELKTRTVYLSPQGRTLTQSIAKELTSYDRLILLCGHYEGVDRRAVDLFCDDEISIGDYVLTGGELPACILVDCVSRMIPGVLSDNECFEQESFMNGLLEYPQYTRPIDFEGSRVPEVLLSGNHADIEKWRYNAALELTRKKRPDLL